MNGRFSLESSSIRSHFSRSAIVAASFLVIQAVSAFGGQTSLGPDVARSLVDQAGIRHGVCVVVGNEPQLAVDLVGASELLVHARTSDASVAAQMQRQADEAGLSIQRLAIERGALDHLPHADNLVDIVIVTAVSDAVNRQDMVREIVRVLRPEGKAFVSLDAVVAGKKDSSKRAAEKLVHDAESAGASNAAVQTLNAHKWLELSKPVPKGVGEWSHWEHGPDNNPVSEDTVIKAPYRTQFLSGPFYIGMPSITTVAGGRTFLAIGHIAHHRREWDLLNKLIARDGYNGAVLWERDLPQGYLVHRSAFVATHDTFYMIDGSRCLLIDPQTGEEKGAIQIPGVKGDWKWMVLNDNILYVLVGGKGPAAEIMKGDRAFGGWSWADLSRGYYGKPHVPWGFGSVLVAYDLSSRQVVWKHTEPEKPIDARGMSLNDGKVFLYCPDQHLRCLDRKTGRVLWTNADPKTLSLIEQPGRGLISTPGFRTTAMTVATPDALIIQGQTRMNVVAISTADGYFLWTKKKVTNNPNAIYVDNHLIMGIGPGGNHVVVDPASGDILQDLKFRKRACTRLTACSDSFFVRGEGTLRFDRNSQKILIDGSARPGCNDGAIAANGLLYVGPWQCDCNLSLIGRVARCSAGNFRLDPAALDTERLEPGPGAGQPVAPLSVSESDWSTYRANNQRSAGTATPVARGLAPIWKFSAAGEYTPTAPTSAGSLVFLGGDDGKVRALDAQTGKLRWAFSTFSPIKMPPTIWEGRAYVGSGDGYVYCLEAATGRLIWRFRAAPVERHIMVYGTLSSTWPVNTGVLVDKGVAYFAAGIIDYDGTSVYAIDAKTGQIKWQNHASGHLNAELRKGVSAQGNLTIQGDHLLLAGGNQVSPASYDLATGACTAQPPVQGEPKANDGRFVGVFHNKHVLVGGRILYAAPQNVSTKGSFDARVGGRRVIFSYGGVPPAWDNQTLALVNFLHGKLTCCDAGKVEELMTKWAPPTGRDAARQRVNLAQTFQSQGAVRWQSDLGESNQFEVVSLAVCPNAVVAALQFQQKYRSQPQWFATAFHAQAGSPNLRYELPHEPLPGGLLVDRNGHIIITLLNGHVVCLGPRKQPAKRRPGIRD